MVEHRGSIEEALLSFGAVLWRGFPVTGPDDFAALMTGFTPFSKGYVAGTSERKPIKGNVMESTRTPPEVYIFLHQEMAYLPFNPRLVAFYCKQPADEGGRTVIADMRGLLEALPPAMQERLVDQGVIYGRNMRNAKLENDWRADPVYRHHNWQQWFGTDDTAAVSAQLEERGINYEWDEDWNLRFWTHRPGVTNHPETGQLLFFNQIYAQTPHPVGIGEEYPALMDAAYGDTVPRPYFVSVGDGKQLTEEEFFVIHNELARRRVDFDWQAGDVLLLENKLTGHGRIRFPGTARHSGDAFRVGGEGTCLRLEPSSSCAGVTAFQSIGAPSISTPVVSRKRLTIMYMPVTSVRSTSWVSLRCARTAASVASHARTFFTRSSA